jgi:hypothetical protein
MDALANGAPFVQGYRGLPLLFEVRVIREVLIAGRQDARRTATRRHVPQTQEPFGPYPNPRGVVSHDSEGTVAPGSGATCLQRQTRRLVPDVERPPIALTRTEGRGEASV